MDDPLRFIVGGASMGRSRADPFRLSRVMALGPSVPMRRMLDVADDVTAPAPAAPPPPAVPAVRTLPLWMDSPDILRCWPMPSELRRRVVLALLMP